MTRRDYLIVATCLLGAAMCAAASWAMEFHPDTCIFAVLGMIIVLCAWACGERRS